MRHEVVLSRNTELDWRADSPQGAVTWFPRKGVTDPGHDKTGNGNIGMQTTKATR